MVKALAFALAAAFSTAAGAQSYPAKPLRVIVATTAGGATDTIARLAGNELTSRLGQPLVIENRAGANGVLATDACAKAGPDGHTLCIVSTNSMSHAPHVIPDLPYNPDRDLRGVVHLYNLIEGMVANLKLPAGTVPELRALATARPGSLNFGTLGPGTGPDLMRQWLIETWKTDIVGVHYKGAQPILLAIIGGDVHFTQISLGNAAQHLRAGKIKILAQGGARRSRLLPDVPTTEEAGLTFKTGGWWGLVMSAQTPDPIIRRVNSEFVRVYREPKLVDFMENQFLESAVGTPEEFAAFLKADRQRAGEIVKRFNLPKG